MEAKNGDRVKVHYTLKDSNGEVIESSRDTLPIEFIIGEGKVIPGFEKGIAGMKVNEKKTVNLPPEEGYGPRSKDKVFEFSRKNAPGDFDPRIGSTIQMHRPDGKAIVVTILGKTDNGFIMDANHPLAGKELTFDLELIEIVDNNKDSGEK
jgi:peptidylprolyl isomerase